MKNSDPIILLTKIAPGIFVPTMPVYVVGDDMSENKFLIALDESLAVLSQNIESVSPLQKKYAQALVQRRLHQPEFRGRVLRAYATRCAVCSLAHGELLDAAHILPDAHIDGYPIVTNGLALCKIHHSAYDQNFLGISPDYTVQISKKLLQEIDGPMLKHGIQEMHERKIVLPKAQRDFPNRDALEYRFRIFQTSA